MFVRKRSISPAKKAVVANMKTVKRLRLNDRVQYNILNEHDDKENDKGLITQELNVNNEQNKSCNQETTNKNKGGPFYIGPCFVNTMSNEELNDHIQKCLEMSSENKITPKNAFALQLIDCMNILLNKKDFSTMACTLDAGAKIYSNRVDALHHQVLKLADEVVLLNQIQSKTDNSKEEHVDTDENMAKEQRKLKKRIVIASPKTLRKNLKGNDPRDKFIRVNGQPGEIITASKITAEDLSITLENNIKFWDNFDQTDPLNAGGTIILPECKIFRSKQKIFDTNKSYINEAIIDQTLEVQSQASTINSFILSSGLYEDIDSKSETSSIKEVPIISTAIKKLNLEEHQKNKNNPSSRFEAMKIIFHKSSEYHYLDMKKSHFWAGPEYWKRTKVNINAEKEKKVTRRKKQYKEINYNDTNEGNKKLRKKCNILATRTINGWKRKKLTLPRDLKFDMQLFFDLFHISVINDDKINVHISSKSLEISNNIDSINGEIDDYKKRANLGSQNSLLSSLSNNGYEDQMDTSEHSEANNILNSTYDDRWSINREAYCDPKNKLGTGKVIKVEIGLSGNPAFGDSLLGPVPKIIRFQPIKYSSRPIRIDMQYLKMTMLEIIKNDMKEDAKEKDIWTNCSFPEAKFRNVLRKLSHQLEDRTAQDLSPSIAIMALLTLANENQLNLLNNESDIVVRLHKT